MYFVLLLNIVLVLITILKNKINTILLIFVNYYLFTYYTQCEYVLLLLKLNLFCDW